MYKIIPLGIIIAEHFYSEAKKIIFVLDNLRVHTLVSLYLVFPPEKTGALARRLEIHFTPKHGSWLNMAEIEIGVLSRQCLNLRIPDLKKMDSHVQAWVTNRNEHKQKVCWQFTTKDARIKLQHLYPRI